MATYDQKNQLIARLATSAHPGKWEPKKLQIFLGLPADDFNNEVAKLFNGWQPPVLKKERLIIQTATLPEPKFPEWSIGRALMGAKEPKVLDINRLFVDAWFHPVQLGNVTCPTGDQILSLLVKSYESMKDEAGKTYHVEPTDEINGHYGLKELLWLEQNWETLPISIRDWSKGKLLYGHRDCVRNERGWLVSPYLNCRIYPTCVGWCSLANQWDINEPALRDQVGA